MSTFKKEIVDKVLAELDYQKDSFGRKSVDLAEQLGVNRATLSKLRKYDQYHNQINADKMQEVLAKLLDMRMQVKIQKQADTSLTQYTEHSIQSLRGSYLSCTYYEQRIIWRDINIEYDALEDIFIVNFISENQTYKGNYSILEGVFYLDLTDGERRDKIMLSVNLGSMAFSSEKKEVFTGMAIRRSVDGQDIVAQKIFLLRKNEENQFVFRRTDAEIREDKQKNPYAVFTQEEVQKGVLQAMGWHRNNFLKNPSVEGFLFCNLQKLNPTLKQEKLIEHFAGTYESWYCSPSEERDVRASIKKAQLKIEKDGSIKLTTPFQVYKGFAHLHLETDVLEINAFGGEFESETRRKGGLSMTFALGGSWRREKPDIHHLHGVSSSVYTDGGPIVMREVLIKVPDNQRVDIDDIPIGSEKYWRIVLGKDKGLKELILFLTGQTDNYIKTFRTPDREFQRWEDYGMLYFTSALLWAQRGEIKECLKNLGLALSHGFHEIAILEYELYNEKGILNHEEIKSRVEERKIDDKKYYILSDFHAILKETTWQYFRKDLTEKWRNSYPIKR